VRDEEGFLADALAAAAVETTSPLNPRSWVNELLVHCYRMLRGLPDAADAVQETLLRACRHRDSVKEGAPMCPWLYRLATNACLESMSVAWLPASSETFQ